MPNIEAGTTIGLLQWKAKLEQEFVFKPELGVTLQELKHSEELSTQRFKVTQARRVLMAATRLKTLADAGRDGLDRSLVPFDDLVKQWRGVAKQLRDFQSNRQTVERLANSSTAMLIGLALGVPLACILFHAIVH